MACKNRARARKKDKHRQKIRRGGQMRKERRGRRGGGRGVMKNYDEEKSVIGEGREVGREYVWE